MSASPSPSQQVTFLPSPRRERWQPLRSGLLNLYRYDHEEFWYEDGHLLLRGNNGTGKSRVLALQLPFLLDGELSPHRVEPDGDPAKRMEWNLLMGRYEDRVGYTWLEFGRRDEQGTAHFLTIGCGLSATQGRQSVQRWFFITRQRVGEALFLQSAAGQPLSRERLEAAIATHGEVYTSAQAYRDAVDAALFHLGRHRYEALVNLLIQLRMPQLSRHLDERKLSQALSEALPPLAAGVIADVADSFRSLDEDRVALEAFLAAGGALDRFLDTYRRYLRIAARKRAERVRSTHALYEATQRKLRAAETTAREAEVRLAEARTQLQQQQVEEAAALAEVEALEHSEAMRDARELERLREQALRAEKEAEAAELAYRQATQSLEARQRELSAAAEVVRQREEEREKLQAEAGRCAEQAGLSAPWSEALKQVELALAREEEPQRLSRPRSALEAHLQRRHEAVRHVDKCVQAVRSAEGALRAAQRRQQDLQGELEEELTAQAEAHQRLRAEREAWERALDEWRAGLRVLVMRDEGSLGEQLDAWCEAPEGPSPLPGWVREALAAAMEQLSRQRAEALREREGVEAERHRLRQERERLEQGLHTPPPPPHTRHPEAREARPHGAQLWRLCDFAPGLAQEVRPGLEAALEASGLLDAWITPEGEVLAADEHETVLSGGPPLPEGTPHLGELLVPSIDLSDSRAMAVGEAVVARILRSIGARAEVGTVWVDPRGTWRLGPLSGAWAKERAEHLGHASREEARRRALEKITAELEGLQQRYEALTSELARVEEALTRARAEADAVPSDGGLRRAVAEVGAAARQVQGKRRRLAEAEAEVARRRDMLARVVRERDEAAADLGIGEWVDRLEELKQALRTFESSAERAWRSLERLLEARAGRAACEARLAEAQAQTAPLSERTQAARVQARTARAGYEARQAAVGAEVAQLGRRLEQAKERAARTREKIRQHEKETVTQEERQSSALKEAQGHDEQLERDMLMRQEAIRSLEGLARLKLLRLVHQELGPAEAESWSVTRAVEIARQLENHLAQVDAGDSAWSRHERDIHHHFQTLNDALARYDLFQPQGSIEDALFVATVLYQGRSCGMGELRDVLTEEVAHRQSLLDAREREVLENHLMGEVSSHLHELLHQAEKWLAEMNDELERRPTSTGMKLRFKWEPVADGPAGLNEARKRLLRTGATWSPEERQAVGAFLKQQIDRVRAEQEGGSWQEHLTRALDYRAWHQFSVERHQDGQWRRLTRRTHGTGSGGEKAIALTLPQFAAAAAHCRSAHPHAPRLILLDEAFVGIDADMRAKCMGLLAAFDLDFVMTSEREWGCYATLPGVAICQLASRPGVDAVHVTRFVWNGRERVREDAVLPPSRAPEEGASG